MSGLPLDFVSPLPPVRSGIADYSVDLLSELDQLVDIRVVQVPGQPLAEELKTRWPVVPASELATGGRVPFYQFGNNVHHAEILRLSQRRPGFVTLHDLCLHHLGVEQTLALEDMEGYVELLAHEHGWIGAAAALPPRWGGYGEARMFELPAHGRALVTQRGVLVHSDWGRRFVEESLAEYVDRRGGRVPPIGVVSMPMPIPPRPAESDVAAFRERHGLAQEDLVLGSFGFQTPIKRTEIAVRALAEAPLRSARLVVVGEASKALDLEGLARQLGVADRVIETGFLPTEELPIAIFACDLCVNLRYPTAGETSASLLRVLALARPAVVSRYAQFAEMPRECTVQVDLDADPAVEAAALAQAIRELGDRSALARLGDAARRYVAAHHDPASVTTSLADQLAEWASDDEAARACGSTARGSFARPTTLTWGHLENRLEIEGWGPDGWSRPWPEGGRRLVEVRATNLGFARWLSGRSPEGGVVLESRMLDAQGRDWQAESPWLPLERDLEPGESATWRLALRRPLGPARLELELHVLGGRSFSACGGRRLVVEL